MQENRDILDDIDIETPKETGTNLQLFRGFLLGVIIQFLIWVFVFKFLDNGVSYIHNAFLSIDILDYKLNIAIILVSTGMAIGAGSYLFLSNAKNQPYIKLLPIGFLFSFLSVLDVFIWQSISNGKSFIELLFRRMVETSFITVFYFLMLTGIILIFKRRFWYVGLFLIGAGFLSMGFIR